MSMTSQFQRLDCQGYTSTIYLLPGKPLRTCKSFNEDRIADLFPVERAVYDRFSSHKSPNSILRYYGVHKSILAGLVLEYAEKHDLRKYLDRVGYGKEPQPDDATLYRWAAQAVEVLEFAHSLGVYNADIHVVNFFLDAELNLKAGDWAGASIDGSKSRSSYRLRHRLFDADGTDIARAQGIGAETEVFAFGTALYVMVTGHDP